VPARSRSLKPSHLTGIVSKATEIATPSTRGPASRPATTPPAALQRVADWHRESAEIIAHLDDPDLPRLLDRSLEKLVPFDISVIFAYPDEAEPLYLYDGFRGHVPGAALDNYVRGAYLLDPFFTACARRVPPNLYRMRELAPDQFFEGEYFNSWEVHPCISMESGSLAEEIGFLVNLPGGFMAAYSLMRENDSPPFSDVEFASLQLVEPVIRQAMMHHWRRLRPKPEGRSEPAWSAKGAVMERAFESFGADKLSAREQMIVQMVLRGHSTVSIASTLGIADGTVKNHRKSIYAKLGIASQQELFSRFIRHLLSSG
jgi:DNA-binding CsgD family transcriptional regulator